MGRADLKSYYKILKRLNVVLTLYLYESIIISTAELFIAGLIFIIENIFFVYIKYTKDI